MAFWMWMLQSEDVKTPHLPDTCSPPDNSDLELWAQAVEEAKLHCTAGYGIESISQLIDRVQLLSHALPLAPSPHQFLQVEKHMKS